MCSPENALQLAGSIWYKITDSNLGDSTRMLREGFLREHSRSFAFAMWIIDLSIVVIAAWVAFKIHPNFEFIPQRYFNAVLLGVFGFSLIFPHLSFGRGFRGVSITREIQQVSIAVTVIFLGLMLVASLGKVTASYSRVWFVEWYVFTLATLAGYRVLLRIGLRWIRSYGFNQRSIVVVGSGKIARTVIQRIQDARWSGFRIKGVFGDDPGLKNLYVGGTVRFGGFDDVADFVREKEIDQVWLTMPLKREEKMQLVTDALSHSMVDVRYVPDIYAFQLLNHSISSVAGLPVINLTSSPMEGANRIVKAIEDKVIALLILLLSSPFLLLIAIAIKLTSEGPVFFRQVRLGWNGKEINMYKFRTMPMDAEAQTGPVWTTAGDDRATPLGRFLRRTSLDEFPQFFNVLRGDMSIVGPRPERPVFVEKFKKELPQYSHRSKVKAGITGWAQVNGWRGDTCLEERLKHDLYYIENWSVLFDIKIIILTVFRGFVHRNAY